MLCASVSRESRKHKLRNVSELYYVVEVNTNKVNKWNALPVLFIQISVLKSFIVIVFVALNSMLCTFVYTCYV